MSNRSLFYRVNHARENSVNRSYRPFDVTKYRLRIIDLNAKAVAADISFKRALGDLAWSPGGDFVAALTETVRMGFLPWELLFASAGHPVPHNGFYLEVISASGQMVGATKIVGNETYGRGRVAWHAQ